MERDETYDPGAIGWWTDNWTARPIEVSNSNNNSIDVTLTFKIKLSTALPA